MNEQCLNCGNPIVMMCQQGTPFCSMNCNDDYLQYVELEHIKDLQARNKRALAYEFGRGLIARVS